MKHKTIRNHKDFLAKRTDPAVCAPCFLLKAKQSSVPGQSRYGILVSKKSFKLAVHRNLAKRKMRDWVAFNEHLFLPDKDYIFILNENILDYNRDIGRKDTETAMRKIKRIYVAEQKSKNLNKIGN